MYWLSGRNSQLTVWIKFLLYKQILRPVWTYFESFRIQLRDCVKEDNLRKDANPPEQSNQKHNEYNMVYKERQPAYDNDNHMLRDPKDRSHMIWDQIWE